MKYDYSGMTVNERLYISGLIEKFYSAVKEKETDLVVSILREIELSDSSIDAILTNFQLKP